VLIKTLKQVYNDPVAFIGDLIQFGDPYGVKLLTIRLYCFSESYLFRVNDRLALSLLKKTLEYTESKSSELLSRALFQKSQPKLTFSNMDPFSMQYIRAIGLACSTQYQINCGIALLNATINSIGLLSEHNHDELISNDLTRTCNLNHNLV